MSEENSFAIAEVMPGKLNALVKNIMRQTGTDDPNEAVRQVNSGEWIVSEAQVKAKPAPIPEPEVVIGPMIRVDRSVRPSYPEWVATVMHPELENVGPAEYGIADVKQWPHDDQKDGNYTTGNKIYAYLKESGDLKNHLGLLDLLVIQKKGIAFFRKHFKGKYPTGWASVVRDRDGLLFVPYLCENGDEVALCWRWLGYGWLGDHPGLRHASSPKS